MPGFDNPIFRTAMMALALIGPGVATADELTPPRSEARKAAEAIRPLPPVAIPDDPPPHEGAMIEIPHTVEPPDILVVEVLQALPGRPITGERLVRPDGTISLGFYGDLHVRGLTTQQIKVKLIHHLREHLTDVVLGVTEHREDLGPIQPLPRPGTVIPPDGKAAPTGRTPVDPDSPRQATPPGDSRDKLPGPGRPATPPTGKPDLTRSQRNSERRARASSTIRGGPARRLRTSKPSQEPKPPQPEVRPAETPDDPANGLRLVAVDPIDSLHVFVDVTSFNSKVYFVLGDVGVPGRLPVTGKETVLDALNFAGGLVPTAEPREIRLYRPARGGKPARDYRVDLDAIHKGDARANLQLFPDDRLVIGRSALVKKAADLDRIAAPINGVVNTIMQYSFLARSLAYLGTPPPGNADPSAITPARREAIMKDWVNFLWGLSNRETLDEDALRKAILMRLTTPPATEPEKK